MGKPLYPSLYEINTRTLLNELSADLGRPATLDDIPDTALDRIAELGFDWVWFLGMWQTGPAGRQVSLTQPSWRDEYQKVLPDFHEDDVCGSPFAVRRYVPHDDFGARHSLSRLRKRLQRRGLLLMLDFVVNHTGLDHYWVSSYPQYYVQGTEEDLAREPQNYWQKQKKARGRLVFAHGRDPYFPGWPDTLQLNCRHRGLINAL